MSYNGTGTFVINSAGTPYVTGTVISSTAANALNNDLATGLTTAITKDGQTTPTANIPLGGFKITNLGAGTVASDAARLSQVQNSTTTTLITAAGTDTITGTVTPTLTAYTAGQVFSFVVAATNTGAVTLNISSLGAQAVTRTGSVALVAGDMVIGQVVIVEYDGTRFQLINGNSFTNLKVSGTLGVTGITTVAAGTAALPSIVSTTGTADTGQFFPAADTIAHSTAGTERMRIDSSGNIGIGTVSPGYRLDVQSTTETKLHLAGSANQNAVLFGAAGSANPYFVAAGNNLVVALDKGFVIYNTTSASAKFYVEDTAGETRTLATTFLSNYTGGSERMRIISDGSLLVAKTTSTAASISAGSIQGGKEIMSCGSLAGLGWENRSGGVTSNSNWYLWYTAGGTIFLYNGSANAASINPSTGIYTPLSDVNKKKDFEESTLGLSEIMQLKPTLYRMKDANEDSNKELGFIAQDVKNVIPQAYVEKTAEDASGNESTYIGLNDRPFIAVLVKAMQEQQAIIETLTARITALETL